MNIIPVWITPNCSWKISLRFNNDEHFWSFCAFLSYCLPPSLLAFLSSSHPFSLPFSCFKFIYLVISIMAEQVNSLFPMPALRFVSSKDFQFRRQTERDRQTLVHSLSPNMVQGQARLKLRAWNSMRVTVTHILELLTLPPRVCTARLD